MLEAKIGDYIAVARRKEKVWYIGSMTDWDSRILELDFSFLGEGHYNMKIFKDGINANRFAEDYKLENLQVNKDSKLSIEMAPGGGWSAVLNEVK